MSAVPIAIHLANQQPKTLLGGYTAAELRRLHTSNAELLENLIYLRNCEVDGIKPALAEVNKLIAEVEGGKS